LRYEEAELVVTIEDDGDGFTADETLGSAEATGHFGIVGMRERAEGAGGMLVIHSEPGRGTIVRASIPYESASVLAHSAQGDAILQDDGELPDERAGFFSRLFGR